MEEKANTDMVATCKKQRFSEVFGDVWQGLVVFYSFLLSAPYVKKALKQGLFSYTGRTLEEKSLVFICVNLLNHVVVC